MSAFTCGRYVKNDNLEKMHSIIYNLGKPNIELGSNINFNMKQFNNLSELLCICC
jgi:hypothetical protein